MMDSFRFVHPAYFYTLVVIPIFLVLYFLMRIMRQRSLRKFGDKELVAQLMPSVSNGRPFLKLLLWMTALVFLVTALAQPQFGSKLQSVKRKGIEIIVALDVSNSMKAEDIKPNRLERAKRAIAQLTERMRNDKIGLIVFAGQAYVQLPITTDYTSAKMFLDAISTESVPVQGTAIGSAINMAAKSFTPNFEGSKTIVIITDGENHEDDAVEAAKEANEEKIIVNTIGMGSPEGAPIPWGADYLRDKNSNVVVTKLDDRMLTEIAAAGGGKYIRANNTEVGLNTLFNEIGKLEKSEINTRVYSEYNEQFPLFLSLALMFLILNFMIMDKKNPLLESFRLFGKEK